MDDIKYREILSRLYDGVYIVDTDRKVIFWNYGAERITGFTADNVIGQQCYDVIRHVDELGNNLCESNCPLLDVMCDGFHRESQIYIQHKDNYLVPVFVRSLPLYDSDDIVGAVETFYDNSHHIKVTERLKELKNQIYIDDLTGVYNKRFINARFPALLGDNRVPGVIIGVIFVDVDNFKDVNNLYGHVAGDAILKNVATTISQVLRGTDIICRWGGDEFVIFLMNTNKEVIISIANMVRESVSIMKTLYDGVNISVSVSVGASVMQITDDLKTVFERVDMLMYASKHAGRNMVSTDIE